MASWWNSEVQVSHSLLAFLIDYFIQLRAKYKSMKVQSFNKITLLDFISWVRGVCPGFAPSSLSQNVFLSESKISIKSITMPRLPAGSECPTSSPLTCCAGPCRAGPPPRLSSCHQTWTCRRQVIQVMNLLKASSSSTLRRHVACMLCSNMLGS